MHVHLRPAFISAAASLTLIACAAAPHAPMPAVDTSPASDVIRVDTPTLPDPQAQARYHVLAAELAAMRNAPALAAHEFLAAAEAVPDVDFAQRATALAIQARDAPLATAAAQRWLALAPQAAEPREVIASLSLQNDDVDQAYTQCQALIDGHAGGRESGFIHCAQLLSQAGKQHADSALSVIQRFVDAAPDDAAAQQALALIALRYQRLDRATVAAERASTLAPEVLAYQLPQVDVWLAQKETDRADQRMAELIRSHPRDTDLRFRYAKLLLDTQQRSAAVAQLHQLLRIDPDHADAHYALGVLAWRDDDSASAQQHFKRLLDGPRQQDAALQLARIAEAQGRDEEALAYFAQVRSGGAGLEAAMASIALFARNGKPEVAQTLISLLRERYPEMSTPLAVTESQILRDQDDASGALAVLDDALENAPDDLNLRYVRALTHEDLGDVAAAEADLRAILARAPDDTRSLNALGYMLTSHTTRYAEAEALIVRALAAHPDDAAIMDSLGWVYFKQGRLEDAAVWLRLAHERQDDAEIAAHLAETLWALGQHDDARAVLLDAQAKEPDHPVLKDTLLRLLP